MINCNNHTNNNNNNNSKKIKIVIIHSKYMSLFVIHGTSLT